MSQQPVQKKGFSGIQVFFIVMAVMLLTAGGTVFAVKYWFFPQPFTPVTLDQQEEQQLEEKLELMGSFSELPAPDREVSAPEPTTETGKDFDTEGNLQPKQWPEKAASREITFTEREINGLLAKNTDLAQKMALDFSDDLVSLRLLLYVNEDFPFLGGKTIRSRAGVEIAYRDNAPVVILKGISLMGVPIPNAWLGGLKNIDLVREFSGDSGFWKGFGDGVEEIRVREGDLYIKLRE